MGQIKNIKLHIVTDIKVQWNGERHLKNAVHTARSNFYAFKGKKRKQTRKEARKEARASKKLKRNTNQTNQPPVEQKTTTSKPQHKDVAQKKRKRKKKKKTVAIEDD